MSEDDVVYNLRVAVARITDAYVEYEGDDATVARMEYLCDAIREVVATIMGADE